MFVFFGVFVEVWTAETTETVDAACVGGCSLVFTPVALVIRLTIN